MRFSEETLKRPTGDGLVSDPSTNPPPPSEAPAREWLSSHTRILEFWRDRLVEDGASVGLVATIDSQINWLRAMQRASLA